MIFHMVDFMISFFKTLNSGLKMPSIIQDPRSKIQDPIVNESHHYLNQCILNIEYFLLVYRMDTYFVGCLDKIVIVRSIL
jgi:hypothetical protein